MLQLKLKSIAIIVIYIFATHYIHAQNIYKANSEKSEVLIEGTSNIHDWEMNVDKSDILSKIEIIEESDNKISSVSFKIPAKSLKSGKGRMDKNTYEALKADDYNSIQFQSTSVKKVNGKLYAVGKLTIAGTTKNVEIPLKYTKSQQGISISTSYKINMLDYNVEPPTAMFGTITTGESVVVKINLIY